MGDWYYTSNRQRQGPVSWEELRRLARAGILSPSDLIWREGMADWLKAGAQDLFDDQIVVIAPLKPWEETERRPNVRAVLLDAWDEPTAPKVKDLPSEELAPAPPRRRSAPSETRADDYVPKDGGMPVGRKLAFIVGGALAACLLLGLALFFLMRGAELHVPANRPLEFTDQLATAEGKAYPVRLLAGRTYVVSARSDQFTPRLRLDGPPDGPGHLQEDGPTRIVFAPRRTGRHQLLVTSRDGRLGEFVLSIQRQ